MRRKCGPTGERSGRYKIEYLAYSSPELDAKPVRSRINQGTLFVPWFWLAYLIASATKNTWEQGGKVTDTKTGAVRITWALSGTIFGDGRAHLTVDGVNKGPEPARRAAMEHRVDAMVRSSDAHRN
jgi:hypothetical protein